MCANLGLDERREGPLNHQRLGEAEKLFTVMAAMVAPIADALHAIVMKDTRLALQVDALRAAMDFEIQRLCEVPDFVWHRLSLYCGVPARKLRSQCIASAHVLCVCF